LNVVNYSSRSQHHRLSGLFINEAVYGSYCNTDSAPLFPPVAYGVGRMGKCIGAPEFQAKKIEIIFP